MIITATGHNALVCVIGRNVAENDAFSEPLCPSLVCQLLNHRAQMMGDGLMLIITL